MKRVIFRVAIGTIFGIALLQMVSVAIGMQGSSISFTAVLCLVSWSIGIVYSSRHYLRKLNSLLNPALKISIISWLSIKTGSLGMLMIIIYVMYILTLGWIYGWYLLIRDIRIL